MSTKIGMLISSNRNENSRSSQIPSSSNRMLMAVTTNNVRVIQNNQNNQALAMNLAQINKTKGCGCGGGK